MHIKLINPVQVPHCGTVMPSQNHGMKGRKLVRLSSTQTFRYSQKCSLKFLFAFGSKMTMEL